MPVGCVDVIQAGRKARFCYGVVQILVSIQGI